MRAHSCIEGNEITDLRCHRRVLRGLFAQPSNQSAHAIDAARDHRACGVGTARPRWRLVAVMGTRDDVNAEIAEKSRALHLLES